MGWGMKIPFGVEGGGWIMGISSLGFNVMLCVVMLWCVICEYCVMLCIMRGMFFFSMMYVYRCVPIYFCIARHLPINDFLCEVVKSVE